MIEESLDPSSQPDSRTAETMPNAVPPRSCSGHLVDPDLRDLLPIMSMGEISRENLAAHRQLRSGPLAGTVMREDVTVQICEVPGHAAGDPVVAMHIYRPIDATGPLPCIFHIHGGGYVMGSVARQEPYHRTMAATLGCAFATVDYRLAPEAPFPGPLDDCEAALRWLVTHADRLAIDPVRTGLMGESAGGGLAAALALRLRDQGGPRMAFQHLIYPMIDDRTCTRPDQNPFAGEFIWRRDNNHFGWSSFLGREPGSDNISLYAAAARAEDLSGLPPTFIATGSLDLFIDENMEYARRLIRAGVPTELHVYPGGVHGFFLAPDAPISITARRDSVTALSRAFEGR